MKGSVLAWYENGASSQAREARRHRRSSPSSASTTIPTGAGISSNRRPSARCCTSPCRWPLNVHSKGEPWAQGYNRTMATPVATGAPERHRELFEELMREVAVYNPDADRDLLERAFVYGSRAHEGQQRRSGEDFI